MADLGMRELRAVAAFLCAGVAAPAAGAPAVPDAEPCVPGTAQAGPAKLADARSLALPGGTVLRLAGIESFALLVDDGDAAEAALQRRLAGLAAAGPVRARLLAGPADRYGRQPALVEAADGSLVQEMLAREGVAIAYASGAPIPCFERIVKAEDEARRGRRGFWTSAGLPSAEPAALQPRLGRFVIFEGAVLSVGSRRTRTYLNFGRRWSEDTTVEIAAGDRGRFGGEAELERLKGRRVRVRGFLAEHGGPVVTIRSPMQIEILEKSPVQSRSKP